MIKASKQVRHKHSFYFLPLNSSIANSKDFRFGFARNKENKRCRIKEAIICTTHTACRLPSLVFICRIDIFEQFLATRKKSTAFDFSLGLLHISLFRSSFGCCFLNFGESSLDFDSMNNEQVQIIILIIVWRVVTLSKDVSRCPLLAPKLSYNLAYVLPRKEPGNDQFKNNFHKNWILFWILRSRFSIHLLFIIHWEGAWQFPT